MNNLYRIVRLLIVFCVIAATGLGCIVSTKACSEECSAEVTSEGELVLGLHRCSRQKTFAPECRSASSTFHHPESLDQRSIAYKMHRVDFASPSLFLIGAGISMRC